MRRAVLAARLAALLAATLLAALFLAGCGLPVDSGPRVITNDRVPPGLLDRDPTVIPTTAPPPSSAITVYLLVGERLAGVRRERPAPPGPGTALQALLQGPTQEEGASGLRSAIGADAGVTLTGIDAGRATVELGRLLSTTTASDQVLAIAQIVYTLTALPTVEGVAFTIDRMAVEVPRGDRTLTAGPLSRADFPSLAP